MIRGCILVEALPGKVEAALNHVKKVEGVRRAFMVFGRYDIVAFIETQNYEAVRKMSLVINAIEGVEGTETLVEA